jgi:hypothetical protein
MASRPLSPRWRAVGNAVIDLGCLVLLELDAQYPMCLGRPGENQNSACDLVQPVNDPQLSVFRLSQRGQMGRALHPTIGHHRQAGGLVQDEE